MGLNRRSGWCLAAVLFVVTSFAGPPAVAAENGKFRLGIVTFLSGPASGPFGVPAENAAKLVVNALNAGKMPAPYTTKGINGVEIETVVVDEAGGASKQVEEFRNLVERQKVDAVIGYISSGDCLAVAPVAEELKALTVFFDCGTPRIFEDASYKYVFRTGPIATTDNIGAARYVHDTQPATKSYAGINQNYAWGQDSWNDFKAAMQVLLPAAQIETEQFPKLGAGQYGAELSAILVENPELVHSSFWGGDMEALVLQGTARGLFDKRAVVLTCGETGMFRLAEQMPEGAIIGGRGPYGVFAPENALNSWFRKEYQAAYNTPPTYPSYKIVQSILGLKNAAEKTGTAPGTLPAADAIIAKFENSSFEAPSGTVVMSLGKGHQAVQGIAYGTFKREGADKKPAVINVRSYGAECVTPPEGTPSTEWIKAGMPGAKCG
jgi:branched-chain amino acid transport system substrate-binding protein